MYACLWLYLCLSDDCVNRLVEASYLFISLCIGSKFCEEENALIVSDPPQATPPQKKNSRHRHHHLNGCIRVYVFMFLWKLETLRWGWGLGDWVGWDWGMGVCRGVPFSSLFKSSIFFLPFFTLNVTPPLPCHQQIVKKESWIWKGLLKSRDRFRVIQV